MYVVEGINQSISAFMYQGCAYMILVGPFGQNMM